MDLTPTAPAEAVELYLKHREGDAAKSTVQNHRYRLKHFLRWCEETGFEEMNEMTGRKAHEYKQWRRENNDLKPITLAQQLRTFRKFLRFCESVDAVHSGIDEKVLIPEVDDHEARSEMIDPDTADAILDYLEKYEYATLRHSLFYLFWHTGLRTGSVYALDVDDYDPGDQILQVRHRPGSGTPLKNKEAGERNLNLKSDVCRVLDDYIKRHRPDVTDEHGRSPLFSTPRGRAAKSNIQANIYAVTRPCVYYGNCPHDRAPTDCESTAYDQASSCPSSVSPHPIRRSAITYHLNRDWPKELASERMNVSTDVLDKHYDGRTLEEQRNRREKFLGNL